MFVKGIKYELRSVSRIVLPMLIIFLCAAMLMSLSFMLDGRILGFSEKAEESDSLLSSLFYLAETALVGGTILLVVVINITVYILIVYRFYVSFFTDEGYLTFTLPLTIDCHLAIKIASMFFWMAASLITTLIGGIIILGGLIIGYADFRTGISIDFAEALKSFVTMFTQSDNYIGAQAVLSIAAFLSSLVLQSMLIYLAIALGCMLFKKHRLVGSVISIYAINQVYSFIFTMSMLICSEIGMISEITYMVTMGFMTVLAVAGIVGAYIGMRYILQKKLNLE